jgi:hypothetical protein
MNDVNISNHTKREPIRTPVAKAGLAANPVKNLNASMVEKFLAVTIGILNITNIASPMI